MSESKPADKAPAPEAPAASRGKEECTRAGISPCDSLRGRFTPILRLEAAETHGCKGRNSSFGESRRREPLGSADRRIGRRRAAAAPLTHGYFPRRFFRGSPTPPRGVGLPGGGREKRQAAATNEPSRCKKNVLLLHIFFLHSSNDTYLSMWNIVNKILPSSFYFIIISNCFFV